MSALTSDSSTATGDTASSHRPNGESPSVWNRVHRGGIGSAVFIVLWWLAALSQPTYLLPGPGEVAYAYVGQLTVTSTYVIPVIGTGVVLPQLAAKLLESLQHYLPGLVIGASLGIALGITTGWSDWLNDALSPVIRLLRPIPPLAWIAFAIVWFGIGNTGATFIVAIGAFWVNYYNTASGVEGVSRDLIEVAESFGVDEDLQMIRAVILPKAAPSILTGVRTSIGQCWMVVVAAELFGAPGVGYQIIQAAQNLRLDVSVAYMIVISAVFIVSDVLFRRVEESLLAWRV